MRFVIPLAAALALAGPARADDPPKRPAGKPVAVPYRLTDTQHVLVRAKINGKGPLNFILDTGALAAPKARGFLGVELADGEDGVTVKAVLAGTPAADAGLKPGDKITEWKGRSVSSVSGLLRAANKFLAGEKVPVTVERGGKT